MLRYRRAHTGFFKPKNKEKYVGNADMIVYRSGLELKFMKKIDREPNILKWASEEICLPYVSPKDNRIHRYFPDLIVTAKLQDGSTQVYAIEVKPDEQTRQPKRRKSKRYLSECLTYAVNQAKWTACQKFCEDKGWQFQIWTEKHLGLEQLYG